MNCPHCQAVLPEDVNQCSFCGAVFLPPPVYLPYRLQINKLFRDTYELYKQHFGTMCLIGLLILALPFVPAMLSAAANIGNILLKQNGHADPSIKILLGVTKIFFDIVQTFCQWYIFAGAVQHGLFLARGGSGFQLQLMFPGFWTFWKYVGSMILVGIIQMSLPVIMLIIGAAAFIAAGGVGECTGQSVIILAGGIIGWLLICIPWMLFFGIRLLFCVLPIVDQNAGVIDSMKQSWQMTAGNFWVIFVSITVLGLAACAGVFLCGIGIVLTVAATPLGFALIYLQLTGQPNIRDYPSPLLQTESNSVQTAV